MATFRTEMTIPVNKDVRTLEEGRKDMLNKIEQTISSRSVSTHSGSKSSSHQEKHQLSESRGGIFDDDWTSEVSHWLSESRRKWDDDIRRIHTGMFKLEPADDFGFDNWPALDSGTNSLLGNLDRSTSSMTQMLKSNAHSSNLSGGVTTTTSSSTSTSSCSSNLRGTEGSGGAAPCRMLQPQLTGGNLTNFIKDAYEVGEDGQVHFKVRFDAKDFSPEDIRVTTMNNRLTVAARQEKKTANSMSQREFCRTIDLPQSIDHEKFQCSLTGDGVLVVDAPVKTPDYKSITFGDDHGLAIRATSSSVGKELALTGQSGPVVLKDGAMGRKIHVEVPVDAAYTPNDISVRTESNKIHITGRHEVKTANSSSFKEFSKYYEIPETVDPLSVTAQIVNGTLIVEAPLVCTV